MTSPGTITEHVVACRVAGCRWQSSGAGFFDRAEDALEQHLVGAHTPREVASALIGTWHREAFEGRADRPVRQARPKPKRERITAEDFASYPEPVRQAAPMVKPREPAKRRRSGSPRANATPALVLRVLASSPDGQMRTAAIQDACQASGKSREAVSVALTFLKGKGRITNVRKGVWRLVG